MGKQPEAWVGGGWRGRLLQLRFWLMEMQTSWLLLSVHLGVAQLVLGSAPAKTGITDARRMKHYFAVANQVSLVFGRGTYPDWR
jgi:hypothetical protein